MDMMLLQLLVLFVGLSLVSALVYLCLKLYARYHPNSELACPGGVRDVWRSVNGEFYAIAVVGILVSCVDIFMGVRDFDIGAFWLFTLVGGLWVGVKISLAIATIIGRHNPDGIMANHITRSYLMYGLLAVSISLSGLIFLLLWLMAG